MSVTFAKIPVGSMWDRKEPAELWGYKSVHAFGRGFLTSADNKRIIVSVKEGKGDEDIQYEDKLDDDLLHWHGEKGHGNDSRIANAKQHGDDIHIFYRASHDELFVYLGRAEVTAVQLLNKEPSRLVLRLIDSPNV